MAEALETMQELALASPSDIVFCDPGDDAVLSCHLNPAISAASMEIKWWNKTDLVFHYKNRQVTMNRHYEDPVSFSLQELHNGNVSLTLRNVRGSQRGIYICEVIHGHQIIKEYIFLHICFVNFRLVVPTGHMHTDSGSDIILPAHLSPETNAVSMDIRWFKGTELIYQYKNGREKTNNDHKNRVSLSTQELRRGNLTLCLRNVNQSDSGEYTCKLFHDGCQKTEVIHLQVRVGESSTDTQTLRYSEQSKEWLMRPEQERHFLLTSVLGPTTKRRRRNSMDRDRPQMSDDGTLEKPEMEKRKLRAIVRGESGHQDTRQTREWNTATGQELSSSDTLPQVLQTLRTSKLKTSVGKVQLTSIRPTLTKPLVIQTPVPVRPSKSSITAGHMILLSRKADANAAAAAAAADAAAAFAAAIAADAAAVNADAAFAAAIAAAAAAEAAADAAAAAATAAFADAAEAAADAAAAAAEADAAAAAAYAAAAFADAAAAEAAAADDDNAAATATTTTDLTKTKTDHF